MIFMLLVVAVFVGVSVYFYFRSENLQRELLNVRRESSQTRKNNKVMADAMALVASKHEEFYKFRLKSLKKRAADNSAISHDLTLIMPLIDNYSAIFRACLASKEQLKVIVKKCYDNIDANHFKDFQKFISGKETHVKRMWSSNNLNGFISLVEALLTEQQIALEK